MTPVYDNAGNAIVLPQPGDPTSGYNLVYDAWNRLVQVSTGSGVSQTLVAAYSYDGLNRRIVKETYDSSGNLVETRHFYLSQADQVLEERVGTSSVANRQYVWGLQYVDDLVLRYRNTYTVGYMRLFAIQDANWNVVAVVGNDGTTWGAFERYTYTAYGQVEVRNADFSPATGNASAYSWTVLYTGRELDMETGLQYNRARYYDAALGRFVCRDPISYGGGVNLYRYASDCPASAVDPYGARSCQTIDRMLAYGGGVDLGDHDEIPAPPQDYIVVRITPPPPPPFSVVTERDPTVVGDDFGYIEEDNGWMVNFHLATPADATNGGYIVQKVDVDTDVKSCCSKKRVFYDNVTDQYPFWEAFRVHAGDSAPALSDNWFYMNIGGPGTFGSYTVTATCQYYDGLGELSLPTSFSVNLDWPSGLTPATKTDPSSHLPVPTGAAVFRSMKVSWNCSGETTITWK